MKKMLIAILVLIASPVLAQEVRISPIKFTQRARGTGVVSVNLSTERMFDVKSSSNFYQGVVKIRGNEFPAAASKINGVLRVTFPGKITGSRGSRQRMYTVKLKNGAVRVSSVPSSAFSERSCASEHEKSHEGVVSSLSTPLATQYKVATISTYADPEFYAIYGSSTNDEIVAIINSAEVIYKSQLGVKFRIVSQQILQNSTPEIEPGEVLSTFRQMTQSDSANLKHLFTGKDMNGPAVGIAYISALCYDTTYSHGVTQSYGFYTTNIFAHELGHNFGANHDTTSYGTLMYPYVSLGDVYFSASSLQQITSHLSYFGSCLSVETPTSNLVGAKFDVTKSRNALMVSLFDRDGVRLKRIAVTVKMLGRIKTYNTKTTGSFIVPLTQKGRYKIDIKTQDGLVKKSILVSVR